MCQITLVKSTLNKFNKLLAMQQALINSEKVNKHGWGVSDGQTIWKTEICPQDLLNGGNILGELKLGDTIVSHVRAATSGIPVTKEMAHPFRNGDFTLVHNGSITLKTGELIDGSDSERFLAELVKIYPDKKNVPEAIEEAQKLFYGPFVYVIHHKKEGWFIARGFGRTIHQLLIEVEYKEKVFDVLVLNSDKGDLEDGIQTVRNTAPLFGYKVLTKEIKPELVTLDSVYQLQDYELVRVGNVKEETAPTTRSYGTGYSWSRGDTKQHTSYPITKSSPTPDKYDKIGEWLDQNLIHWDGIDYLTFTEYGKGILELEPEMLEDFITKVMPLYKLDDSTRRFIVKKVATPISVKFVQTLGLEYPLAGNDHNDIVEAFKRNVK